MSWLQPEVREILQVMDDTRFVSQAVNLKVYDLMDSRHLPALTFKLPLNLHKEEQNFRLVCKPAFGKSLGLDCTEHMITSLIDVKVEIYINGLMEY